MAHTRTIDHEQQDSTVNSNVIAQANRVAPYVQWVSLGLMVLAVLTIVRALPVGEAIRSLEGWFHQIGMWGPLVYGLIYIVATLLLAPGSVLTLTAGVFFGLFWGAVTVSIASTTAVALAFLIGRHLAREHVARKVRQYAKFDAVDRALGEGGWRIVALLRLSPAVPFNLQNYLYGVTPIGFWATVLTSWLTMLPGTILYVYVGYVSRESIEAATGTTSVDYGRWALLILGLLATAIVTVYITRLAKRMIRTRTEIMDREQEPSAAAQPEAEAGPQGWPWKQTVMGFAALALVVLAACAHLNRDALSGLLGPPPATLHEAYQPNPDGPAADHSVFDALLRRHVDDAGWVDYAGLNKDVAKLDAYLADIASAPFDRMGRNEKLALLINAYNAFTLKLILEYRDGGKLKSIRDIPADKRWADARWKFGSHTWSLNEIEHEQIRPKFKEPRIHFALVCAAVSCPPLRNEAYDADRIDQQLEEQTKYVHNHKSWFRFDADGNVAHLTPLYKWYGGDFRQVAGSELKFAARYSSALKQALEKDPAPTIEWLAYDWALNSIENKESR